MIQVQSFIKTSLLLLIILSLNAEAQVQHERQQRSRQAETYMNKVEPAKKLKFGDRKPTTTAVPLPTKLANFRSEDSIAPQSPDSVEYEAKRFNKPLQQQHFTQYEIPMIEKRWPAVNVASDNSYKGQRENLHHSTYNISSARSVNISSESLGNNVAKSQKPEMQHEKRVAVSIATPRNWTRNSSADLNAVSMKVNSNSNSLGRKQRKQYASNATQRSSGLLTARPHSRKSAVAITTTTKTTTSSTTTSTTTKATTTTTTRKPTTQRPGFLQNNPFNIFSPEFWGFSNPTTTPRPSSKKPPKKYTPISPSSTPLPNEQKHQKSKILSKAKTTSSPTTTTQSLKKDPPADGPFRIALPTFNFFNPEAQKNVDPEKEKEKRAIAASLREKYNCPRESEVRFQLFPKICKTDEDCSVWNREELCCEIFGAKSCVSGVAKPLEETSHAPILGLIQRKCPSRPLAELWWEIKECHTDMDCWPRVCCPDGRRRYCRTSQPELETAPIPVKRSFDYLSEYLECTPPPPPIFDLHPKACTSTLDCFPNVCCQEAGLRHCRPPKKSVLTLMANFLNVDVVKRFAQNIFIK